MKGFNSSTTFTEFKVLLEEDLRLEYVGKKKSKYTIYLINI
jgi:hypothetical protein